MTTPRGEVARKSIHIGVSLVAAAMVLWLPAETAAVILAAATAVALSVEVARRASGGFGRFFQDRLGAMLRPAEGGRLTGASSLSIGYTLVAVLLPGSPALAGILITGTADAAAAVVGRHFGRIRYPGGKSVEGSLTFLATVTAILWALPGFGFAAALAGAFLLTIIEAPTVRIDDNLYLPMAGGAVVAWLSTPWAVQFFS